MRDATGIVVWLTGLPGAGKTTIARLASAQLRAGGGRVSVIDGDVFRARRFPTLGFTPHDRSLNVGAIIDAADRGRRGGATVIVAAVSPYRQLRSDARERFAPHFLEVHVRAPLDECVRRDPKGLYAPAIAGELPSFTRISGPYEEPEHPELVLDTARFDAHESAAALLPGRRPRPAPR